MEGGTCGEVRALRDGSWGDELTEEELGIFALNELNVAMLSTLFPGE